MLSQRAGDGENPAELQFRKWTAKGTMKGRICRVSCDVRLTSVAGDMLVSRKAHIVCEAGWHRDKYSSLAESFLILPGTLFFIP